MKKVAILFISMLVFSVSFADGTKNENSKSESAPMTTSVTGKVLDKLTGEALVGVKVTLKGTEKSVYTDFEGNFEFDNVRVGDVELATSYISYKNKIEKVDIGLDKSNNINVQIESVTE